MTFGKGSAVEVDTTSAKGNFPLYTGIAPVTVVAVNPTAEELSSIYGRKVEKIADYTGKNPEGKEYVRLDFILKVADNFLKNKNISEPLFGKLTIFLMAGSVKNKDESKLKVINDYGQTQWVTAEIYQKMGLPVTNDGREMTDFLLPYKPCFAGEDDLVAFLRAYLSIDNPREKVGDQWVLASKEKLEDCQSSFSIDEIKQMISGNISPVKNAIDIRSNNHVKVLFTVRVSPDNKKYQHVYSRYFVKAKVWDEGAENMFKGEIAKNQQSVSGMEFGYPFSEWKESPTDFMDIGVPDVSNVNPWA